MDMHGFDIVACPWAGLAFAFLGIEGKKNKPAFIYYAHDCMASEYVARKILPLKFRLKDSTYYKLLVADEKSACDHTDLIVANSHAMEEAIQENYGIPSEKINNGWLLEI